jgi:hypothetical protein
MQTKKLYISLQNLDEAHSKVDMRKGLTANWATRRYVLEGLAGRLCTRKLPS